MLSVARVMMNGWGNRPQTYPAPLTKPTAAPVASITTMTTAAPLPLRKARAPSTEASANVEPTDRSMPLVMMTSSWPIASKAIAAVCDRMLPTLPVVRNTGDRSVMATTRPARMRAGPSRITVRAPRSSR